MEPGLPAFPPPRLRYGGRRLVERKGFEPIPSTMRRGSGRSPYLLVLHINRETAESRGQRIKGHPGSPKVDVVI